ncbi:MAG: ATP phosphoribosyltransferase regulatory subunit [Clostridia bacterium]|nr:ATP phosphoribosyltransferase regulatory subunit [Clostridia bacterium]
MLNSEILKPEEQAVFALRDLYRRYGYLPYKMSKFEEYDLYVKNKDFLISDGIITFTDTAGKLLALKPDVTLSIIKNSKDVKGSVQKVYYNESVYRIAHSSHTYKEIMQTGLECIGDISSYEVCEVVGLALESLSSLSEDFILDLSHAGLVFELLKAYGIEGEERESLLTLISQKNENEAEALVKEGCISDEVLGLLKALMGQYSCLAFANAFAPYAVTDAARQMLEEFSALCASVSALGYGERINVDFSLINHMNYYSGVVFKGYIKGMPDSVLSGGRYDLLMRKMGRESGAIGFAVYLDGIERLQRKAPVPDADILLIPDGGVDDEAVFRAVAALSAEGKRVNVRRAFDKDGQYGTILRLKENGETEEWK